MTIPTSQQMESYIPLYDTVPEEWENAKAYLTEQLKRISEAINTREIGFFLDEELLSGKQFIPGANQNQQFRSILRMVIDFGQLPNAGTKTVPHNINVDANFSLIDMYISATDPMALVGFSLQYWSIAPGDIKLSYDATNVIVTTASNYSAYTRSFIVMEYMQEL